MGGQWSGSFVAAQMSNTHSWHWPKFHVECQTIKMPSRKRQQGKARKNKNPNPTKAPPLYNWREYIAFNKDRCSHGDVQPSQVSLKYIDIFESFVQKRIQDQCDDVPGPGTQALRALGETHPEFWEDQTARKDMTKIFAMMATDHMLHGCSGTVGCQRVKDHAAIILLLESNCLGLEVLQKSRDLNDGGQRALVKFIKKHIKCECLDKAYANSKRTSPLSMSRCHHCHIQKERSSLLLCGSCKVDQYCSPACQKAAWPAHKKGCRYLVAREATFSTKA